MKKGITIWLLVILIPAAITWRYAVSRPIILGDGILAPFEPSQTDLEDAKSIKMGDFTLKPLAEFQIKAKVLSRKRYRMGKEAKLSPVDLAMGWGKMSDERTLESIKIRQSGRWYQWSSDNPPIPVDEIKKSSANMHIIPADDEVEKTLKSVRRGEIVLINGYLVAVSHPSGWKWNSSTSRDDTGDGACEIIYAKNLKVTSREAE